MTYSSLSSAVQTLRTHLAGSYAMTMASVPHDGEDISECAIAKYLVLNPGSVQLYGKRVGSEDLEPIPAEIFHDGYYLCAASESVCRTDTGEAIVTDLCISSDVDLSAEAADIKAACQLLAPEPVVEKFWPVLNGGAE